MSTVADVIDYSKLSNIQISRMAAENARNAEKMVALVATDQIVEAAEADDALRRVSSSADELRRSIAEIDQQIEAARCERGEALANEC